MGIEPTPSAWKAEVLPLNYTRSAFTPNRGAWREVAAEQTDDALAHLGGKPSVRTTSPERRLRVP